MRAGRFTVGEAAELLGVSDDTVRRWADAGRLPVVRTDGGRLAVEGRDLAALAQDLAQDPAAAGRATQSARNQFRGLVTRVVKDTVMAQVELQAGPFRVVSLMSREAADELGLEVGTLAVASTKATQVVVGLAEPRRAGGPARDATAVRDTGGARDTRRARDTGGARDTRRARDTGAEQGGRA